MPLALQVPQQLAEVGTPEEEAVEAEVAVEAEEVAQQDRLQMQQLLVDWEVQAVL